MLLLRENQKRLLNGLNPIFVLAWIYGAILFRTSLQASFPRLLQSWDILLPFAVYFGQRRPLFEGVLLTLFSSHLFSLCSSASFGIFGFQYLFLFVVARLISHEVYANSSVPIFTLIFLLGFVSRLTLPIIASLFGTGWDIFTWDNLNLFRLLWNSVLGFLSYWILHIVDKVTFKVPRVNIELTSEGTFVGA